jgi:hypothetical protein
MQEIIGVCGDAALSLVKPYRTTAQVRITRNNFVSFGCPQAAAFATIDDLLTA